MKFLTACCLVLLSSGIAFGAITPVAEYHLGEAGSLSGANNLPQDSIGTRHYPSAISGNTVTVGTSGVFAPGSTAYLNTSLATNEGFHSASYTGFATDNFAFGIFARATGLIGSGIQGDVFTLGGVDGAFKIGLTTNGWGASIHNVGWIGPTGGVLGSYVSDQWVHLAVIRASGISTFYINGVAQTPTTATAPVQGASHLSVNPGGAAFFDGLLDEARVVTFTAGESPANIINALQAIPEPSSLALLGLGSLGLLNFVRRRG
jgi:hypothetical protein